MREQADDTHNKSTEPPLVQAIPGKLGVVAAQATKSGEAVVLIETAPGNAFIVNGLGVFVAKAGMFSRSLSGFEFGDLKALSWNDGGFGVLNLSLSGGSGQKIDFLLMSNRLQLFRQAVQRILQRNSNWNVSLPTPETPSLTESPGLKVKFADDAIRSKSTDKENLIQAINSNVDPDETVHALLFLAGQALVVSDKQAIIIKTGASASGSTFFNKSHIKSKGFPLKSITAVENSWGNITGRLQLSVPGCPELPQSAMGLTVDMAENVVSYGSVEKAAVEQTARKLRELISAGQTAPAPDDIPEQILKLANLRDVGVLTEDEFQAKKTELLSRM